MEGRRMRSAEKTWWPEVLRDTDLSSSHCWHRDSFQDCISEDGSVTHKWVSFFLPSTYTWSSLYETDCPFFSTPLTTHISPHKFLTSKQSHQRQKSLLPGTRTVYLAVDWTIQQAEWLQCFTSQAGLWNLIPPLGQRESSVFIKAPWIDLCTQKTSFISLKHLLFALSRSWGSNLKLLTPSSTLFSLYHAAS